MVDRLTSDRLRYALMATMTLLPMHARLTAITGLTISSAARLSVRDRGSMVTMVAADSTGAGRLFMVAGQAFMGAAESGLTEDSAVVHQFAEVVDSIVSPRHAVAAGSTVEVDSVQAVGPAVVAAGSC